jgi:hypothetical protein
VSQEDRRPHGDVGRVGGTVHGSDEGRTSVGLFAALGRSVEMFDAYEAAPICTLPMHTATTEHTILLGRGGRTVDNEDRSLKPYFASSCGGTGRNSAVPRCFPTCRI